MKKVLHFTDCLYVARSRCHSKDGLMAPTESDHLINIVFEVFLLNKFKSNENFGIHARSSSIYFHTEKLTRPGEACIFSFLPLNLCCFPSLFFQRATYDSSLSLHPSTKENTEKGTVRDVMKFETKNGGEGMMFTVSSLILHLLSSEATQNHIVVLPHSVVTKIFLLCSLNERYEF